MLHLSRKARAKKRRGAQKKGFPLGSGTEKRRGDAKKCIPKTRRPNSSPQKPNQKKKKKALFLGLLDIHERRERAKRYLISLTKKIKRKGVINNKGRKGKKRLATGLLFLRKIPLAEMQKGKKKGESRKEGAPSPEGPCSNTFG